MYFSKIIKTGEKQREFNFRRLSGTTPQSYSVDVPDDKGNRIVFHMYLAEDGDWKTATSTLPVWVHQAEPDLSEAIKEVQAAAPVKLR